MGQLELDRIKTKIKEGKPVFGTVSTTREPMITEMMGAIGYDFVWIDNEHSVIERSDVLNHIIAAKAGGLASFVRVVWNESYFLKPILDMGPDGVILPYIGSVQEAAYGLESCLYPPEGNRGYGPQRARGYNTVPMNEYLKTYKNNMFRIFQIERAEMIEQLDEICQLKNIDLFMVGPNDLSGSLGCQGRYDAPEYLAACDKIANIATKHGIPFGAAISSDIKTVKFWRSKGAAVMCCGLDSAILSTSLQNILGELRTVI